MNVSWQKKIITSHFLVFFLSFFSVLSFAAPSTEGIQVYHKNIHLSEEHKQKLADDLNHYNNADDNMWELLRHEMNLPHYEDNPQVQEQIEWFLNHQDYLLRSATRAAPYLYYIVQQVRKRRLPLEVALLPMIESAYNPFAYSTAGAAGIWQMMPKTASGFGIKQDWWYDGRRDVVASTKAALDYVSYLGSFFDGNWLLAIAAYDTGEGNVLSAIRKNIRNGYNTDFWSLPLATETRIYIPRLLALATIISRPALYPINWPSVRNAPYLAQIDIGSQIDLKLAARLAGLSLKKMSQLNSGHKQSATDPNGPFKLVLPIENVQQFTENLEHTTLYPTTMKLAYSTPKPPRPTAGWSKRILEESKPKTTYFPADEENPRFSRTKNERSLEDFNGRYTLKPNDTLYMVRRGDDLNKIAKRFHISTKALIAVNGLKGAKGVHVGSQLIIPTHREKTLKTKDYHLVSGDTVYMVRRGDTVDAVARKFKTSPSAIRLANLLTSNQLQEGDRLVIPTHVG